MDDQGRKVIVCDNGTGVSLLPNTQPKLHTQDKPLNHQSLNKNHFLFSS